MASLEAIQFPYKLLHVYPGMRPRDEVIWDKFVPLFPAGFDTCYYNEPVGDPSRNDNERAVMEFNGAKGVTQWRVDVIGVKDKQHYVIEIKPNAGPEALGQAVIYKAILVAEGKIGADAKVLVITDTPSAILSQAAGIIGAQVVVV